MNEYDFEPVLGLPARLPAGEDILWQGAPRWETLARRALRVRQVSIYFGLLAAWCAETGISAGTPASGIALSVFRLGALGVVAVTLLALFAWLVARTTMYTITTRRVVIRFGIALPITIQIAFSMIASAGVRIWQDGAGDIALSLQANQRIAYLVLWPHVRPWKITRAQPAFRGIPDAAKVAQLLGRALAASASQPAKAVAVPAAVLADSGEHVTAAA